VAFSFFIIDLALRHHLKGKNGVRRRVLARLKLHSEYRAQKLENGKVE